MSPLLEIFENPKLKLPLIYNNGNDEIFSLLKDTFVELSSELRKKYAIIGDDNYKKINDFSIEIIKSIEYWYEGNISKAKINFNDFLLNQLLSLPQKKIPKGHTSFRVRTSSEHKILNRKALFHIPFELRNKISTQRFSIPGFPCLYVGNSIYICWEELNRPQFHDIQAAKFKNKADINLYNLSYNQYDYDKLSALSLADDEIIKLLLSYPIIASCSIQVPQSRQLDPFKPEYLIPQIILQTLMEQKRTGAIGIVYSSTKIYKEKSSNKGEFENIVLPTTSAVRSKGYCTDLTNLFDMTPVVAGWPVDFVNLSNKSSKKYSFGVEKLELDGIIADYKETQFALLEKALMDNTPFPIPDDFVGE